jgi:type I site-specific restriction endonuclease
MGGFRRTEDGRLLPSRPTTVRRTTDSQTAEEDKLPPFVTLNELLTEAKTHEAEQREAEWSYRLGYVRPRDIATLLESHDGALRQWTDEAETEDPLAMGTPRFVRPSWAEVRGQIFQRDGNRCTRCGSPDNLEAHHVEAVCDGGLSAEGNLTTLCRQCHRGF